MTGSNEPIAENNILNGVTSSIMGEIRNSSTSSSGNPGKVRGACDGGILFLVFFGDEREMPFAIVEESGG